MSETFWEKTGSPATATGTGTNAGVTVTVAAPGAGYKLECLGIQVSGDLAALVTIESPSGTVLWQERFSAAYTKEVSFPPGIVVGASNAAMLLKISASTAHCEANIQTGKMSG